jgi:hypothetical protein
MFIVALLAKIKIFTCSAMISHPNDGIGVAFITDVVLMDYDSITQLFNDLLPAIDARFS